MTTAEKSRPGPKQSLESVSPSHPTRWVLLALLWLVGNCLRLPILAVPPLLPAIHHSLRLSESLVGALSGLPIFILALAAVPGSFVISRLDARRSVIIGLLLCALGGGARGMFSATPVLFTMTLIMATGIAISQPALPSLVRHWFGNRVGLATAVYSNGFLIGEIAAASLTVPLILPLVANEWQWGFAVWSLPVVAAAALLLILAPQVKGESPAERLRWWPDWRHMQTWRLGLTFGCASVAYFGSNAFLPDYLRATHHSGQINLALASLNISQLPTSFLVAGFADRLLARRWPLIAAGLLIIAAVTGLAVVPDLVALWAGITGFSSALVFVLMLALPPMIAREGDVHRLSAAMFTLSYTCAAIGSFLGGVVWDITGVPVAAFAPVALGGAAMIFLAIEVGTRST